MDEQDVRGWSEHYLADFAALGRGDRDDVRQLLAHYAVPLLVSTDAGTTVLTDEAQVLAFAEQQLTGLRSTGYDRSEELSAETTVLNRSCAMHRGDFARLRADGSEITRLEVTYLVADTGAGLRISALVVHSPR
jgi:uncharacterized NTF2-like protein DUF6841